MDLKDCKLIKGSAGYYIRKDGMVFNPSKKKILIGNQNKKGYISFGIVIKENGLEVKRSHFAHRLVAEAFIPNPNNYPQVNHKNGIPCDNYYLNLEWCTAQQNVEHSILKGLKKVKTIVTPILRKLSIGESHKFENMCLRTGLNTAILRLKKEGYYFSVQKVKSNVMYTIVTRIEKK